MTFRRRTENRLFFSFFVVGHGCKIRKCATFARKRPETPLRHARNWHFKRKKQPEYGLSYLLEGQNMALWHDGRPEGCQIRKARDWYSKKLRRQDARRWIPVQI